MSLNPLLLLDTVSRGSRRPWALGNPERVDGARLRGAPGPCPILPPAPLHIPRPSRLARAQAEGVCFPVFTLTPFRAAFLRRPVSWEPGHQGEDHCPHPPLVQPPPGIFPLGMSASSRLPGLGYCRIWGRQGRGLTPEKSKRGNQSGAGGGEGCEGAGKRESGPGL